MRLIRILCHYNDMFVINMFNFYFNMLNKE